MPLRLSHFATNCSGTLHWSIPLNLHCWVRKYLPGGFHDSRFMSFVRFLLSWLGVNTNESITWNLSCTPKHVTEFDAKAIATLQKFLDLLLIVSAVRTWSQAYRKYSRLQEAGAQWRTLKMLSSQAQSQKTANHSFPSHGKDWHLVFLCCHRVIVVISGQKEFGHEAGFTCNSTLHWWHYDNIGNWKSG